MMLYIGKFLHMTNQQKAEESERRHGEFNLIVQAENDEAAVERFKERIVDSRESYYKSIAGDPVMPYISCSTPNGETDGCRILNWMKNRPEIDGEDANLFIEFKSG
jgi:hypothetical protein